MRLLAAMLVAVGCGGGGPAGTVRVAGGQAPAAPGRLVVDLVDGTSLERARAATGLPLEWATATSADEALAVAVVDDLARAAPRLAALPLVEAAEPSMEWRALGYPDDPLWPRQWNLRLVGAPAGWRAGAGAGVVVAVVDTGVSAVPDLEGVRVLRGVSVVPGAADASDRSGHGTHVAGTVAQATNNGLGVAGIAPRAAILPVQVLGPGGRGRTEWIAAGIDEAVDRGAQVVNLSLGGPRSAVVEVAVRKALAAGATVVAAAGNSGREGLSCPACIEGVLAVSATGPDDALAPYSSWGEGVALAAPGGDRTREGGGILQDTVDGAGGHTFREMQGTSMAAPHVSGAAAVLRGMGLQTAEEVREALLRGAVDLGEPGPDPRFGAGRLDLAASVRHAALALHGRRFAAGAVAALLLALAAGPPLRRRPLLAALAGGLVAGGAPVLPLLPGPPLGPLALAARPPWTWPELVMPLSWARSPLVRSAALPLLAAFLLGPTRLGPAVAAGVAGLAGLMAAGGLGVADLPVSGLGPGAARVWLLVNAGLAAAGALAANGVRRHVLRQDGRRP